MAHEKDLWYQFLKLLPSESYTFSATPNNQHSKNAEKKQLFLGQNRQYRSWAYLKLFSNKACEVLLIWESASGHTEPVNAMADLPLQYPFRAFKKAGKKESTRQLKTFIQYCFLDARIVLSVYMDVKKTFENFLQPAVGNISRYYESKSKIISSNM